MRRQAAKTSSAAARCRRVTAAASWRAREGLSRVVKQRQATSRVEMERRSRRERRAWARRRARRLRPVAASQARTISRRRSLSSAWAKRRARRHRPAAARQAHKTRTARPARPAASNPSVIRPSLCITWKSPPPAKGRDASGGCGDDEADDHSAAGLGLAALHPPPLSWSLSPPVFAWPDYPPPQVSC